MFYKRTVITKGDKRMTRQPVCLSAEIKKKVTITSNAAHRNLL